MNTWRGAGWRAARQITDGPMMKHALTRRSVRSAIAGLAVAFLIASAALVAQEVDPALDWWQWGGPSRDFLYDVEGLAETWPTEGPPVIWSRPLGAGHSAIIAAGGRLYTMYRVAYGEGGSSPWAGEEAVIAIGAATGETLWEYAYPSVVQDFDQGAGPHATPLQRPEAGEVRSLGVGRRAGQREEQGEHEAHAGHGRYSTQTGRWRRSTSRSAEAPPDALGVSVQATASERASAFLTALPSRFDSLPSLRMIRASSSVKSFRRILQGTWSPALRHS